jgi:hypothetical protein
LVLDLNSRIALRNWTRLYKVHGTNAREIFSRGGDPYGDRYKAVRNFFRPLVAAIRDKAPAVFHITRV